MTFINMIENEDGWEDHKFIVGQSIKIIGELPLEDVWSYGAGGFPEEGTIGVVYEKNPPPGRVGIQFQGDIVLRYPEYDPENEESKDYVSVLKAMAEEYKEYSHFSDPEKLNIVGVPYRLFIPKANVEFLDAEIKEVDEGEDLSNIDGAESCEYI